MPETSHVTGLILAGGRASRFQCQGSPIIDKGLLVLDGLPLVEHVQRYMKGRVGQVWVSANRNLDNYGLYGRVVTDDVLYGHDAGPLAGVASAMSQLSSDWLFTLPVDTPFVPSDLLSCLMAATAQGARLASARTSSRQFPLCMLVHRSVTGALQAYLAGGQRRVMSWQQQVGGVEVCFEDNGRDFFNINTPNALQQAQLGNYDSQ